MQNNNYILIYNKEQKLQMEKYSKHLESIVADRTADLVAEKAKTDRLLYSKHI